MTDFALVAQRIGERAVVGYFWRFPSFSDHHMSDVEYFVLENSEDMLV